MQRNRAAENERDHDEVQTMLEIIAHEREVSLDQVVLAHAKSLIYENIVGENDAKLQSTRDQRTDGRTAHAKLRRAEVARDQHIVDRAVGDQRDGRYHGRDAHDLHGSEQREQRGADRKEQVGPAHDGKVLNALFHDRLGFREKPYDLIGEQACQRKEQNAKECARQQNGLAKLLDESGASLSPVLAAHGDQRVADTDGQLLVEKLQGIDCCHARERSFAVAADH